ncbi:thiol reductant ABC exporter subunit CydD [Glaciibacter psychrotolerans]|uniref:ATP-binding cassette subfamily C protein CydD n=1 Tax=Glaciibacter psychrotolerans TaxID=670054 RepID=A0A7Z0J4Y7_9MICO|nr:thiol reductant ABC exporter subunit CydD [Leifsonia psychrotolerans]NYJ18845.1 ATP-binding cassette subfamily C protein CydD [Leifsonia psychrotolerans]
MRPLDPRLLRYASAARWFFAASGALSVAQTGVVIAFSWLLSQSIVRAIAGDPLAELAPTVGALAAVIIVRAILIWLQDGVAERGAAAVKSQLRAQVLDTVARRGPDWLAGQQNTRIATLITSGLDALDNYFARYLPQLLLSAIATPILLLVVFLNDLPSGIIIVIVLPLIPVFMILIGWATQTVQRQQWEALQRLGAGFLDLVGGMGTLKIFGRERRQGARLRTITEDYRQRTMKVLRVTFLSGFVLELAGSLSVALVAVTIGLRLIDGSLTLAIGLFVLLLTPEVFLPIRQVGAQFHAAADGLAAAEGVFEIIEEKDARSASVLPRGASAATEAGMLSFSNLTVHRGERETVSAFSARFEPGVLSVISGPSGAGKSTVVTALHGHLDYDGEIALGGETLTRGTARSWLAWAGQRPGLFAGSIEDNLSLGDATRDPAFAATALAWAGASDLDPATVLGVGGEGLSGGQAQRVAVARAFYRALAHDCAVVVLDEPSSALDSEAESALIAGARALAETGRIVIVISHRPAFIAAADHLIRMREIAHV